MTVRIFDTTGLRYATSPSKKAPGIRQYNNTKRPLTIEQDLITSPSSTNDMGVYLSAMFSPRKPLLTPTDEAMQIVLLGLSDSGKTSLLYRLKLNEVIAPIYTMGFSLQTIEHKETKFTIWDIGGSKQYKSFKPLLSHTDAVVLVVDSTNEKAFAQVRHIMDTCLIDEHLKGRPLLVLANKQDLPYAMKVNVISKKLGLSWIQDADWLIYPCCVLSGDGIYEGLEWVGNTLRRLRQLKNTASVDLV